MRYLCVLVLLYTPFNVKGLQNVSTKATYTGDFLLSTPLYLQLNQTKTTNSDLNSAYLIPRKARGEFFVTIL